MSFPSSSIYQATLFLPKCSSTTPSPHLLKTLPRQWRRFPDPIGGGRRNGARAAADRGVCAGGAAFAPPTAAGLGVVGCWCDPRFAALAGPVLARGGLPWEGGGGASQARVEYGGQIRGGVEVTVTCYKLLGLPRKAVKDEIVKSVMELKRAEIEEGYTLDLVASRQIRTLVKLDLLMDVRDKLLFEPEYSGDSKAKIPPTSSLRIPWTWLSGAVC